MAEVEQLAMMEESLNEDFQIEEDMEVAVRETTTVEVKYQEERWEAVGASAVLHLTWKYRCYPKT